jgi:hypothetical protein
VHARHQRAGPHREMRVEGATPGGGLRARSLLRRGFTPAVAVCRGKKTQRARRNANGERISPLKRPREEKTNFRSKSGGAGRYGGWHTSTWAVSPFQAACATPGGINHAAATAGVKSRGHEEPTSVPRPRPSAIGRDSNPKFRGERRDSANRDCTCAYMKRQARKCAPSPEEPQRPPE